MTALVGFSSIVDAIAGWLAAMVFVKGSLLIALALVATRLLRSVSAATRSVCWTALGVALVALPLVSPLVPRVSVRIPEATATGVWPTAATGLRAPTPVLAESATDQRVSKPSALERTIAWMPATIGLVWLAGLGLLVSGVARGLVRVRTIRRRATPIEDDGATAELRALGDLLGVRRRVRLYYSPVVDVPVTGGVFRPFVILPDACDRWSGGCRRTVLLHELAHVARWDAAVHLLFEAVRAIYWPNPLVWRAMRRATTDWEIAADDRVLIAGTNAADYASELLSFAAAALEPATARAVLGLAPSALKLRMRAILESDANRSLPTRRHVSAVAAVAVIGVSSVASLSAARDDAATQPDLAALKNLPGSSAVVAAAPRNSNRRDVTASLGKPREDSLLTELLRNSDPRLRLTAARALRRDGAQGNAVRVLVSALSDSCHGDRWRAARALRDLRDDRALPGLVHQLVVDEHAAVRSMAANAIATSGVSHGAALLRSALAGAPTAEFTRVARAIDTLGDSPAYERLLAALRDARREQSRRPRVG